MSTLTPRRRDVRPMALLATLLSVAGIGSLITLLPDRGIEAPRSAPVAVAEARRVEPAEPRAVESPIDAREQLPPADPLTEPQAHGRQARLAEIDTRFTQALAMLHAGRPAEALVALDRVLRLDPAIPEAHANRGYALLGLDRDRAAFEAFRTAIDLNPAQANAYYGIAIVQERAGNLAGALGGMRSFLHLSQDQHFNQIHVARARSAIWEWEAQLGRGPWGPTRGIPPGFTAEEIKRDGRGVGIKMPIPGTERPDGSVEYEIKAQDVFPMFRR